MIFTSNSHIEKIDLLLEELHSGIHLGDRKFRQHVYTALLSAVHAEKDIIYSTILYSERCGGFEKTISWLRDRWNRYTNLELRLESEKTFFDKVYAPAHIFSEMFGIIEDLDAEIGAGGDLDYHLREDGFADRIKSALAKAKIILGEGDD